MSGVVPSQSRTESAFELLQLRPTSDDFGRLQLWVGTLGTLGGYLGRVIQSRRLVSFKIFQNRPELSCVGLRTTATLERTSDYLGVVIRNRRLVVVWARSIFKYVELFFPRKEWPNFRPFKHLRSCGPAVLLGNNGDSSILTKKDS